jgi:hypothetical protein
MFRRRLAELALSMFVVTIALVAVFTPKAVGNDAVGEPGAVDPPTVIPSPNPAPPVAGGEGHKASHSEGRSMALARRISPSELRGDPSSPVPDGGPQDDDCVPGGLARFHAPEARQGVAVDERFYYVIGNRVIGKYDRKSHQRLAVWEGPEGGPIEHLNSGVVVDGRLYCAHSNYPGIPMTSSVEIWDTETLAST